MADEATTPPLLDNAARILQLWPLVVVPLALGMFAALYLQGEALKEQNALLEQDMAALHGQVVQLESTVKDADDDRADRQRARAAAANNARQAQAKGTAARSEDAAARKEAARKASGAQAQAAGRARTARPSAEKGAGAAQAKKGARRTEAKQ